jgi:hypothetical protein
MTITTRQIGNHWVRTADRLMYVGSWNGASSLELAFYNDASTGRTPSPFIEYVYYPWSANATDAMGWAHAGEGHSDDRPDTPPPRSTLIRATVCDHADPRTLVPLFQSAGLTDIFMPESSADIEGFSEFRIHRISSSKSLADLDGVLRAQLKALPVAPQSRPAPVSVSAPRSSQRPGISPTGKGLYIFTAAAFNYFPKAKMLARSVRAHLPDAHLCMALSDVRPEGFDIKKYGFDSVIAADDLGAEIPNLEGWTFRHDVMELSTAIKPFVLNKLLALPDCAAVLFLDPDCYMFGDPSGLLANFAEHSILITPHQTKAETDDRMMFREINHLRFGIYNLGFLGVRNDDEGRRFATWWQKRLSKYCLIDLQTGLFTDQRWIDHVPVFFNRVKILRDSVYNVACWNFRDRLIQGDPAKSVTADGLPICFFHFAGTTGGFQKYMKWWGHDKPALQRLLDWYLESTKALDDEPLFTRDSPYDRYQNGESVGFLHRLVYREEQGLEDRFPRPYSDVDQNSFFAYVSGLGLPDYTRSDLLFGPPGKLLFHIKKGAEWAEAMRAIQKKTDRIESARSALARLIA